MSRGRNRLFVSRVFFILFAIISCGLGLYGLQTAVSVQPILAAQPPVSDPPVLDNVLDAFNRLDTHGVKLAANINANFPSDLYLAPRLDTFLIDYIHDLVATVGLDHFQGIQRIGENHLLVSGAGTDSDNRISSHLFLIELGSKSGFTSEDFWRSNLLSEPPLPESVPTSPPGEDRIIQILYPAGNQSQTYWHTGGMSVFGNILAVPLESDDQARIVFYNISDPTNLTPFSEVITRHVSAPVTFTYGGITETFTVTNKGGAVFLTQLHTGHYLLGVWSDSDLMNSSEYGQFNYARRRLTLYLSTIPNQLDFSNDQSITLCSGDQDIYTEAVDTLLQNSEFNCVGNLTDFPDSSNFQNINAVLERDNNDNDEHPQLYLIGTRNASNIGSEGDWATLYRFDYIFQDEANPGISNFDVDIDGIINKQMHCDGSTYVIYVPVVNTNENAFCNFQAGAGIYINNENDLSLYAVDYYLRGDNDELRFQEFRSLPSPDEVIHNIENAWVELYEGADFDVEERSWMVDYVDRHRADYVDFERIGLGQPHSARWQIPEGYEYVLYSSWGYRGNIVDTLPGSGIITGTDSLPQSQSAKFHRTEIQDINEAWIELYYDQSNTPDFSGLRLKVNGFISTTIHDYMDVVDSGGVIIFPGEVSNAPISIEENGDCDPPNDCGNFNDRVTSIRFQIPEGYVYYLYQHHNFTGTVVSLTGTGFIEEMSRSELEAILDPDTNHYGEVSSSRYCGGEGPVPDDEVYVPLCPEEGRFTAEYFAAITNTLNSNTVPAYQQYEDYPNEGYQLNYFWGSQGPASPISSYVGSDNFAVRWTGTFDFLETVYEFTAVADDGVRIYVDGDLIVDRWEPNNHQTGLHYFETPGQYEVVVEYYETTGNANVQVSWDMKYGIRHLDTVPNNETWSGRRSMVELFDGEKEWQYTALGLFNNNVPAVILMEFDEPITLSGFEATIAGRWGNSASYSWGVEVRANPEEPYHSVLSNYGTNQEGTVNILISPQTVQAVRLTIQRNTFNYVEHVIEVVPIYSLLTEGMYEETSPQLTYHGSSPWLSVRDMRASGHTVFQTSELGASVTFQMRGDALVIRRPLDNTRGNMEVCIDGECTVVNNYVAGSTTYWQSPVSFTGLGSSIHNIEIRNTSAASLAIDAIEVLNPQPLGTGVHENNNRHIVYNGRWVEWFADGPSQTSLTYVMQAGATAEFHINGNRMIVYRTTQPNWGTLEVCIDSLPCQSISSNAPTTFSAPAVFDNLGAGIHHVLIRAVGGLVDIDAIEVVRTGAPLQTGLHQETSQLITRSGSWQAQNDVDHNGGTALSTTSMTANMTFTVEGSQFVLYRSLGPDQGRMEVCIDTICNGYEGTHPTNLRNQPLVFTELSAGVHQVSVHKAPSSGSQAITVDAVLIPEPLLIGKHQENDINLVFRGRWINTAELGNLRQVNYTQDATAQIQFSFIGDGLIIRRLSGPGRTVIRVCVDNTICKNVSGQNSTIQWDVPVAFTNLGAGLHQVKIYPLINAPTDPVLIDFDAVEILGPTTPLTPGQFYLPDDNSQFVHNGRWLEMGDLSAMEDRFYYNGEIDSSISFRIEGNEMILYVVRTPWSGILQVCIDNNCQNINEYNPTTQWQVQVPFTNLGIGIHRVTFTNLSSPNLPWVYIEAIEVNP